MAEYEDDVTADTEGSSELVLWARGKMNDSRDKLSTWREEAISAYATVAGNQWDETDKANLEEEGRPVFTFNRVAGFIRGICGLESSTRNQVRFYARELEDSGASDVMNAAIKWVREGCDAEDEEADAFKDMLICGLGWTETIFTNEFKSEGEIIVERVDPLSMRWDAAARKRGLADRRWNARIKNLPLSSIKDVWGKEKAAEVEGMIEHGLDLFEEFSSTPHDATSAHEYDPDNTGDVQNSDGVPVVQFQYIKTMTFYKVVNPQTGATEELTPEEYETVKDRMGQLPAQSFKKRQYRQLFYCGTVELEEGPIPSDGYTFQPITGIRDRNNGVWYGFVRDMIDPQRWINKFFSSMADVVASQAKGGLLAEADAFVSKERAAEDWADPRSIVWLKSGGMEKIKERQSAGVPAGFSQLLEFTVGSLPHVAGVNLEFLGLAGREQAGVLENQRKQAAIATLSEFFNALRLYRKQQGRVLVKFINEFISDSRLIRVVGKQGAQFVPLVRVPGVMDFDLVVDEAPDSPDQKGRTWEALLQILPAASKMGFPIPPDVIEYAPFPQALIQDWQKFAQGEAGLPPEMKEKIQQMQEQLQALQQENQQLKSKKDENMAKLQLQQAEGQQDAQIEMQRLQAEIQINREKMELQRQQAALDMQLERERMQAQIQLEREKAQAQILIRQEEARANMQLQREQAENNAALETERMNRESRQPKPGE